MESKYIFEWFQFADYDLDAAEVLLSYRPQRYEIICYHCQQAAEKYLKGYLFYCGTEVPKIHLLDRLCEMCSEFDVGFDEIAKQCATLTAYGVQPRYPDEIYVDEALMKQALAYARQIKEFASLVAVRQELEKAIKEENTPPTDETVENDPKVETDSIE